VITKPAKAGKQTLQAAVINEFYFTGRSVWINFKWKNNQTYLQFKKTKRWKANRNLDWLNKSDHCTLQDGKEAVSEIQSDLENKVYDKEGDKGSFSGGQHMDSQSPWRKKTSNQYLFKRHYV
jgi:hypothetical protein